VTIKNLPRHSVFPTTCQPANSRYFSTLKKFVHLSKKKQLSLFETLKLTS